MVLHNNKWDKRATQKYNKKHGLGKHGEEGGNGEPEANADDRSSGTIKGNNNNNNNSNRPSHSTVTSDNLSKEKESTKLDGSALNDVLGKSSVSGFKPKGLMTTSGYRERNAEDSSASSEEFEFTDEEEDIDVLKEKPTATESVENISEKGI